MYKWKLTKNVDCFEHNLNVFPTKKWRKKGEEKPANRKYRNIRQFYDTVREQKLELNTH